MGSIPRAGKDRGPHIAARKWQYGIAMAMLLVGIAASTFLCIVLRNQEHGHVRKEFEQRSQDHVSAFRKTLDLNLLMMQSIKSFYASSQDVDRGEFKTFVTQLMENHPSIRAVQWAPRVPSSKRSDYEAAAVRDGYPGFRITKYDDEGKLVPVRGHKECYPVIFIEPMKANVAALGFDLAGNPACLDAMDRKPRHGSARLDFKILLPDESGGRVSAALCPSIAIRPSSIRWSIAARTWKGSPSASSASRRSPKRVFPALCRPASIYNCWTARILGMNSRFIFIGRGYARRRCAGRGTHPRNAWGFALPDTRRGGTTMDDHLFGIAAVHCHGDDLVFVGREAPRACC